MSGGNSVRHECDIGTRAWGKTVMSDEVDWNFGNEAEAKAELRAAAEYLLRGATGGARGDIVQEILAIVRDVANGSPEQPNPFDDGFLPGG